MAEKAGYGLRPCVATCVIAMDRRDHINLLLTRIGMIMEDHSADCICARTLDNVDLDALVGRCDVALIEIRGLLAKIRKLQDSG